MNTSKRISTYIIDPERLFQIEEQHQFTNLRAVTNPVRVNVKEGRVKDINPEAHKVKLMSKEGKEQFTATTGGKYKLCCKK